MSGSLPLGFAELEPFAQHWAGSTAVERAHLRAAFPEAERNAFHAACAPLLARGLEQLGTKPLRDLSPRERRLLNLFLTFAHVSLAVEVQGSDEGRHSLSREAMRITREPAAPA